MNKVIPHDCHLGIRPRGKLLDTLNELIPHTRWNRLGFVSRSDLLKECIQIAHAVLVDKDPTGGTGGPSAHAPA